MEGCVIKISDSLLHTPQLYCAVGLTPEAVLYPAKRSS